MSSFGKAIGRFVIIGMYLLQMGLWIYAGLVISQHLHDETLDSIIPKQLRPPSGIAEQQTIDKYKALGDKLDRLQGWLVEFERASTRADKSGAEPARPNDEYGW